MTPHRLNGSLQRVRRAEEHLAELEKQLVALGRQNTNAFTPYFEPYFVEDAVKLIPNLTKIGAPMSIGIRIGEICYNLRSALDYLVFELVRLDAGAAPKHVTQFPIESKPEVFKSRRRSWLKGINDVHVAALERYQPYKGCDWTALLQSFSNRDKHREFVDVQGEFYANAYTKLADANFDSIHAPIVRAPHPVHGEVDVKVHITMTICFRDKTPIMGTLNKIKDGVVQALADFHPDF